ncbi:MAG: hypothetical protein LAO07_17275, partial [Acidobacteriia bacterium]|nr:hypothetical protein [Terriglobia bacterium]
PLVGLKEVTCGGVVVVTLNAEALVPVPADVVTLIAPVVAAVGTAVEIRVSETTAKVAAVPWNATLVAPVNPVPLSMTAVPTGPVTGLKEVTCGGVVGGSTVNAEGLVPVPADVVRVIIPLDAPVGTDVLTEVSESTLKVAGMPLKRTAVAPVNPLPAKATAMPGHPLVGEKEVIEGGGAVWVTVNDDAEIAVPQLARIEILPVVAPTGTTALI